MIYMHDGQNLFDRFTSFRGMGSRRDHRKVEPQGLEAMRWHTPRRRAPYRGVHPFVDSKRTGGRGEAYLSFIVATVKPLVDRTSGRWTTGHTGIMGSSMEGADQPLCVFPLPGHLGVCRRTSPYVMFASGAIYPVVEKSLLIRQGLPFRHPEESHLMKDEGLFQQAFKHTVIIRKMRNLLIKGKSCRTKTSLR